MTELNFVAVAAAAVAALIISGVYYGLLADQLARVSAAAAVGDAMTPWQVGAELLRSLVTATVTAVLGAEAGVDGWAGGLLLGVLLWIGFPLMLWAGAMLHEGAPWRLAAIHGGDWLAKLVAIAAIVSVWP